MEIGTFALQQATADELIAKNSGVAAGKNASCFQIIRICSTRIGSNFEFPCGSAAGSSPLADTMRIW